MTPTRPGQTGTPRTGRLLSSLLACLLLSACGGEDTTSILSQQSSAAAGDAGERPAGLSSDPLLGLGCGWTAASDAGTANVAFPDEAARYWVALVPMTPGNRLRIDGRYPDARYFSYNSYDLALRPTDAIADNEIVPAAGAVNPFTQAGAAPGGGYTAWMVFGAVPTRRETNTFYSGSLTAGTLNVPNGALVPLIYRTYVATGANRDGDVGLPLLTLETSHGTRLGTLPDCSEPLLPNLGGLLPSLGLNDLINQTDYPDALALPFPTATYPAKTSVFYGLPDTVLNILLAQLPGGGSLALPELPATGGGGFLSNIHNAYTSSAFARRYGNLFLLRAKAPSWRGRTGTAFGREQVRYWSLCQNEFATQRYTDCRIDADTALDADGYFTVAVSDAADRPLTADSAHDITWLPWGVYPDGLLLYRQMLADPDFDAAIAKVPKGTPIAEIMAEYTPQTTYCRRAVFERPGLDAGQRFAACAADQAANPPALP